MQHAACVAAHTSIVGRNVKLTHSGLVFGTINGSTVNLYDTFFGTLVQIADPRHTLPITAFDFDDPACTVLVTSSLDRTIRFMTRPDASFPFLVSGFTHIQTNDIPTWCGFYPAIRLLYAGFFSGLAGVWTPINGVLEDVRYGSQVNFPAGAVTKCKFSRDGTRIAALYNHKYLFVRVRFQEIISTAKAPELQDWTDFDVSPSNKFAVATVLRVAHVYIQGHGVMRLHCELKGHVDTVTACTFCPTADDVVVTASADHTLRLWGAEKGECLQILSSHSSTIQSCAFSFNGEIMVSVSATDTRVWDMSGTAVKILLLILAARRKRMRHPPAELWRHFIFLEYFYDYLYK